MDRERKDVTRAETISAFGLWFAILAPPVVWSVQLLLVYGIPEAVVCAPGSRSATHIFDLGIGTFIQIVNAAATAVTLVAFVVASRTHRRLSVGDRTEAQRARWMASAGMFVSAVFFIGTAITFASPVWLSGCGS